MYFPANDRRRPAAAAVAAAAAARRSRRHREGLLLAAGAGVVLLCLAGLASAATAPAQSSGDWIWMRPLTADLASLQQGHRSTAAAALNGRPIPLRAAGGNRMRAEVARRSPLQPEADIQARMEAMQVQLERLEAENKELRRRLSIAEESGGNEEIPATRGSAVKADTVPAHHVRRPNVQTPDEHVEMPDTSFIPSKSVRHPRTQTPDEHVEEFTAADVTSEAPIVSTPESQSKQPEGELGNPPSKAKAEKGSPRVLKAKPKEKKKINSKNFQLSTSAMPSGTSRSIMSLAEVDAELARRREGMSEYEKIRSQMLEAQSKALIREQKNRERLLRNVPVKPPRPTQQVVSRPSSAKATTSAPAKAAQPSQQAQVSQQSWSYSPIPGTENTAKPMSGYFGDLDTPMLKWRQDERDLDVSVFLSERLSSKGAMFVDFQDTYFTLVSEYTQEPLVTIWLGGRVNPRHCGWEWYDTSPYEVKLNLFKHEDAQVLWDKPILIDSEQRLKPELENLSYEDRPW